MLEQTRKPESRDRRRERSVHVVTSVIVCMLNTLWLYLVCPYM